MKKNRILMLFILFALAVIGAFKINELKNRTIEEMVIFNLGSDYNTLDPHLFTEMIAVQVDSAIYEGLLTLDREGKYTGGVAENFVENGNIMIFNIRDDAKWSDGSSITAGDFVFAFRRVLDPKVAAQFSEMLFPVKNAENYYNGKVSAEELGIRAINDKTLEIELEYPTAYFKYILTLPISVPLKEEFYVPRGDRYAVKLEDFLFNGPYKIVKLNEDEIELEKNENYWDKENIKIEKIKYVISKDFRVVDNLIKNKEIDMSRVENYHLANYKKEKVLDTFLNGRIWYLEYNLENRYLQNKKLRKSISIVIDREKYVNEIKKDGSISAKSVISDIITGYEGKYRNSYPDKDYFRDNNITEAKKLYEEALKELGVEKLRLNLLSGNSDPEILEIQFIQEELRTKLGLETDVITVPFKERLSKTRADDYDIVLNTWSPKYDDPLSYLERWKNKKNENVWSKTEYNILIEEISRMNGSNNRDKKINEAEKILIDEAVITPLYYSVENHYRNPKINGIVRRPVTGITDFRWAYIKK